jgi:hypothetical protein
VGRRLYRPLAAWAETDIGRFHRRLSLLIFAVAAALSVVGLVRWGGGPGTGLLVVALTASLASLVRQLRPQPGCVRQIEEVLAALPPAGASGFDAKR